MYIINTCNLANIASPLLHSGKEPGMKKHMTLNKLLCLSTAVILTAIVLTAPILGGSAADPLITKAYLNNTIVPGMETDLTNRVTYDFSPTGNSLLLSIAKTYNTNMNLLTAKSLAQYLTNAALLKLKSSASIYASSVGTTLVLSSGDRVFGGPGTQFILTSGSAKVGGSSGRFVINITTGKTVTVGNAFSINNSYLLSEKGDCYLTATGTATVLVCGKYQVTPAFSYAQQNVDMAFALCQMHLFSGTGSGFMLDRKAMRSEGLVMMLNFMGLSKEASAATGSIPFTDVPSWLRPYVVYAYKNGLTSGTSATKFSPDAPVSSNEYVTFLLRALGYADGSGKDFTWETAVSKAQSLEFYTAKEFTYLTAAPFVRDKMVYASFYMLSADMKSSGTLLDSLISNHVMTAEEAASAMSRISRER